MKQETESKLSQFLERPKRAVWVLAGPMMVGFTVHALYSIVDAIFIGMLGPMALAAATFVSALFFIAVALGIGFATGTTATVANAVGRNDREAAGDIASSALGMGLIIGIVFLSFGLLAGQGLLHILGAEGESASLAWEYFSIICFGMPLVFISISIRAVLTGEGDAKTPMIILAMATIINAALDPICIFSLEMGIRGAAVATVIAQAFSLSVFCYIVFIRRKSFIQFRFSSLVPNKEIALAIAKIGLPAAMGQLIIALGTALINRLLAHFGQTAVAGYGAGSKIDLIVALPIIGLASATVSVVGMFAGAGRTDLVRSTAMYTYKWVVGISIVIGIAAYSASEIVIGFFTEDSQTLAVGTNYLSYMVFAYPLMAFGMTTGRILQGLGHGMPAFVITFIRVLLIAIPAAYIAVYRFQAPIDAVWIFMIAGGVIANILAFFWVRTYVWQRDPTRYAAAGRGAR